MLIETSVLEGVTVILDNTAPQAYEAVVGAAVTADDRQVSEALSPKLLGFGNHLSWRT